MQMIDLLGFTIGGLALRGSESWGQASEGNLLPGLEKLDGH